MKIHQLSLARLLMVLGAALFIGNASAAQWRLSAGGGPQAHTNDTNHSVGLDLNFFELHRTPRHFIELGAGITYLGTSHTSNRKVWALSIYPQINAKLPRLGDIQPWFFCPRPWPYLVIEQKLW